MAPTTKPIKRTNLPWISLLLPLAFGCRREPDPPIRIGTCPWPAYEFLHLAHEQGFFEAEGVRVQLVEYSAMGDMRRAYERGQLDGMTATVIEILLVREQSRRTLQAFYVIDYSNGSDCLVADKSVADIQSLRGKTIGFEPGTLDLVVIFHALKSVGLTVDDVKLIPMSQLDMPEAFASGRIDAAEVYPPSSTKIQGMPGAHRLFDSSMIPGVIVDVLTLDQTILTRRRADAARIIRAYVRAQAFTKEHPEEAMSIMARREGISFAEMSESLKGIKLVALKEQAGFFAPGGKLERALEANAQALIKLGLLKQVGSFRASVAEGPLSVVADR